MRYRFYRVHKYVCYELAEFEKETAKTDFTDAPSVKLLKEKWDKLAQLLEAHAAYEDEVLHELLRKKNNLVQNKLEQEHRSHAQSMIELTRQLDGIFDLGNAQDKILQGNSFYLAYRLFYSEMLRHLYDEEKIILPELQALYTDKELAASQAKTYAKMNPQHMLDMLLVLFPHFNAEDKAFFLQEMQNAEPKKFEEVWVQLPEKYKN